jgi:hypothetical protein
MKSESEVREGQSQELASQSIESPRLAQEQGLNDDGIAACRCGSNDAFPCRVATENYQVQEWQVRCPVCARRGARASLTIAIELWNNDITK